MFAVACSAGADFGSTGASRRSSIYPSPCLPVSKAPSNFGSKFLRRYSFAEVVLFDPMDPATIYGTLRVPDNELAAHWSRRSERESSPITI